MSDFELSDLLELCAPEYNMPELSDRVLVFDVMHEGWETTSILVSENVSVTAPIEVSHASVEDQVKEPRQSGDLPTNAVDISSPLSYQDLHDSWETTSLLENVSVTASIPPNEVTASVEGKEPRKSEDLPTNVVEDSDEEDSDEEDSPEKSDTPVLHQIPERSLRQHNIYVHSFWLSIHSPYFRSLFHSSGMKENQEKEVHVKISESEENAHLILIEAMYRDDVLDDKTADEKLSVLELANKYQLKFVFEQCKYSLQTNPIPFEISTKIMHVIKVKHDMNDVEDLLEILQPILIKEFSPLDKNWPSYKFTSLSELCLEYVLSSDNLSVQSENTVFHALMHWIEENEVDPEETNDLLSVVRFKLVTIDYLYNVIGNHPIASKMPKFSEFYHGGLVYHALPSEQKKLLKGKLVIRKTPEGIQYPFVVKKEDFETALTTGSELNSEKFWVCGYKISVGINPSSREIYPYMIVHNLKKESYVPLKFAFLKEKETKSLFMSWNQKAFSKKCCRENNKDSFKQSYFKNTINTLYVAVTHWDKH